MALIWDSKIKKESPESKRFKKRLRRDYTGAGIATTEKKEKTLSKYLRKKDLQVNISLMRLQKKAVIQSACYF